MGETDNTFTVFRRQVVQTNSYEPSEASCSVTITLKGDESQEDVANKIAEWGTTLEIANYEALGVGYEMTENGVRRLEKSVSQSATPAPVAQPTEGNKAPSAPAVGGSGMDELWRSLMNDKSSFWQNWDKKITGEHKSNAPDYNRKTDRKGLWIKSHKGEFQIPDWFVCPFSGKSADELKELTASYPKS